MVLAYRDVGNLIASLDRLGDKAEPPPSAVGPYYERGGTHA